MRATQTQLAKKEKTRCSAHYTCHLWLEKRIVVCTQEGDILLAELSGEFKMLLPNSPGANFSIRFITAKLDGNGFLVSTNWGKVFVYEQQNNMKQPYEKTQVLPTGVDENGPFAEFLNDQPAVPLFRISAMQNLQGDRLVYSTPENQLMMMKLADKQEDSGKISYFIEPFHTRKITAISICLKKPLLVTAGVDNTLRLYNHSSGNQLKLQYVERVTDPIESLDLHPSGIYLITASKSKLRYYTVCLKRFVCYHTTNVNECNVVRFSHGGHMFAAQEMNDICVYKFFTGERPASYRFMFHIAGI